MVLKHRDFRMLWLGQVVSQTGNQFNYVALAWLVLQLTGSTVQMGAVAVAQMLPNALFGWVAGVAVDRFDRRRLMMACSAIRGVLVLGLPLAYALDLLSLWPIYVVTFAVSTLTLVFYASEKTVIPHLVPPQDLTEANAYAEMTSQAASLAGPVLAGLLIAVLPSPIHALYVDVVGFAASVVALAWMRWRDERTPPVQAQSPLRDAIDGVRFLGGHRFLLVICCTATAVNFLLAPFAVVFPVFADRVLECGVTGFGWMMGGFGGGMLCGSLATPRIAATMTASRLIYGSMVVSGVSFGAIGMSQALASAVLWAAVAGFVVAPANAIVLTRVQQVTPPLLQGRVFASIFGLVSLASPLGVAAAAWALEGWSARIILMVIGALTVLAAVVGSFFLPPDRPTSQPCDDT